MKNKVCLLRRLFSFILLILIIGLCACSSGAVDPHEREQDDEIHSKILLTFKNFLDKEGFVSGLTQQKLILEIVPKYKYKGKTIDKLTSSHNWDDKSGGGWTAGDERFGFSNSYVDGTYSNRFYTTLPLDGLVIPFGIKFGDSIAKTLSKIGIDFDPADFVPDSDNPWEMTLISENETAVIYSDMREGVYYKADSDYPYCIYFVESTSEKAENGNVKTVDRCIYFSFDDKGLMKFEIWVTEKR